MKKIILLILLCAGLAEAQAPVRPAVVVATCGSSSFTVGGQAYITVLSNGRLCSDVNGSTVTATISTGGLASSTKQSDGSQKTQIVDGSGNVVGSTGNALDINIKTPATLPVSAAALPLPALAATSTKQSDGTQKTQVVDASGNVMPSGDTVGRPLFQKTTDGTSTLLIDPCQAVAKTTVAISQTTDTKVISQVSAKKNYICSIVIVAGAAEIVGIVEGTGSTCGTSTTAIVGSTTDANSMSFAANSGFVAGNGGAAVLPGSGTNVDTCLMQSGTSRVSGWLTYVQQ